MFFFLIIVEKEEDKKAQGRAKPVFTAKRGNGVFGTHLHRRVHKRWAPRRGAH